MTAAGHEISGFLVVVEGRRYLGFWAGKAFVSVAIIVVMSWLVFWIDPKFIAPRLSVTVTSMLTLIAYRFRPTGRCRSCPISPEWITSSSGRPCWC